MAQRRTGIIAFVFCICLWLLPLSVLAASTTSAVEPIDTQAECKLNVLCICYGDPYQEAPVKIYKIASVSSDFQYTLTEDFALTNLEVNGIKSDSEWRVIRSTIENYIASKNITHLSVSDTDSTGKATFVNLTPGLYLVTVGRAPYGIDCEFDSALVFLPHLSGEGLWEYEVTTSPKYEILPPITPDSKTEYKVLKLWKGDDEKDRPESVKVEIFKNGTSYKTVTLSAENNWSYTWSTKEYGVKWTVTEKDIPIEYVMILSKSGRRSTPSSS